MTIKEMETRSGVARANIRYYEAEGLLFPQRLSNGYRAYSQEDLLQLEKIKLLRRLGVSLEELRALSRGGAALSEVLDRRLSSLSGEQAALRRVEQVCGALREEGPTFETLEPERYLEALDAPAPEDEGLIPPSLPESDALPAAVNLGRRLAARWLDGFLLMMLEMTGYALSGRNVSRLLELGLVLNLTNTVVLLVLEPALIHLFGATPGKALLGLRLTRPDGERLGYGEAVSRHAWMLWGALGLGIPIWSWIQIYRCCRRWADGEPQPWDAGVAYRARPFQKRHFWGPVLVCLTVLAVVETAGSASQLPPHRGELTATEFAENYNRQAAYLYGSTRERLTPEGVFTVLPDPPGTYTVRFTEDWQERFFRYDPEDGALRAVTLVCRTENAEGWVSLPRDEVIIAVTAFAWASREAPFFAPNRKPLLEALGEADLSRDFTLERDGVKITWELEEKNFEVNRVPGVAIPGETGENALACRCTVALTGA